MIPKGTCSLLMSFLFLASCDNAKDQFMSDCTSGDVSPAECECYYDHGEKSLEDEHMKLMAAYASGRKELISRAQADLGMIGTGVAMAKITWVVSNAEGVCSIR